MSRTFSTSDVWVRRDHRWQLVLRHSGPLLVSGQTGDHHGVRTPIETVSEWFEHFAQDDLAAAHQLFAADGVFYVFTSHEKTEIRGFDDFLAWYARRRESLGGSFQYRVDGLLAGDRHAAALITLSRTAGGRRVEWRQLALYEVEGGVITEARAYEEPERASGSWCAR